MPYGEEWKVHAEKAENWIKLQNTKVSSCISLKYIKSTLYQEEKYVSIHVTNLVCSWVQHEWLAFLFSVHMTTTCQRPRSGNYSEPGQHLPSPGKNKVNKPLCMTDLHAHQLSVFKSRFRKLTFPHVKNLFQNTCTFLRVVVVIKG